ncbi:MAG: hypothetical protein KBB88_00665 [Candidatus Pacebacteria bacterium]|nr:hypothetical protein [Candidatus Paceibacterota bacterium]
MKIKIPKFSFGHHDLKVVVKEKKYRKLDPTKTWRLLLVCTGILVTGSVVFHFYLYYTINKDTLPLVVQEEDTPQIDEEKLSNTLDFFEKKSVRLQELSTQQELVKDPSL